MGVTVPHRPEVAELLAYVRAAATQPWLYPMLCTAAHSGARRSELLRMEAGDVDLDAGEVTVRERKRSHEARTTRRVTLTPFLVDVLRAWLAERPAGRFLFSRAGVVARSRTRRATTGHKGETTRSKSLAGRTAGVSRRLVPAAGPVTPDEANDHLDRTLAGSKWEVLRGWHVLRHSFISALAAEGVDQRVIDEFVGHVTEEQRRRYRHLAPDVRRRAIGDVFDGGLPPAG